MTTIVGPIHVDGKTREGVPPHFDPDVDFGVFDTLLCEDGVRWFEDRHLARLRHACAHFGIRAFACWDVASELASFTSVLMPRPHLVRVLALRPRASGPQLVITIRPPRDVPVAGVELLLTHAAEDPHANWKTTRRADRDADAARAEDAGCFDALRVGDKGRVVEASRGNVFAVIDGRIYTPPLADGALPGIVRGLLLESLPGVIEARITLDDLRRASEVWLTGSGVRIAGVRSLRGRVAERAGVLAGPNGPHTRAAQAALAQREAEFLAIRARDDRPRPPPH